ncbi:MAG: hypothetical protein ACI85I_002124 [Arenicella sp.]|jgi:hypothetical protein
MIISILKPNFLFLSIAFLAFQFLIPTAFAQSNCTKTTTPIKINSLLETNAIDSSVWRYPWYVVKHSNGFENTLGEGISEKDTAHIILNSNCTVSLGKDRMYLLPFAKAILRNDTLKISIFDESASNFESLEIQIVNNEFSVCYNKAYMTGAEIKSIDFSKTEFTTNQANFQKGDLLKGYIKMVFVKKLVESSKVVSLRKQVSGDFEVRIE